VEEKKEKQKKLKQRKKKSCKKSKKKKKKKKKLKKVKKVKKKKKSRKSKKCLSWSSMKCWAKHNFRPKRTYHTQHSCAKSFSVLLFSSTLKGHHSYFCVLTLILLFSSICC
jgi:hypothetical protein